MLLEVQNLTIDFQLGSETIAAVAGIDWALDRGETLCLVGESGSGKSVTALALMGLLPRYGVRCSGHAYFSYRGTADGMTRVDLLAASEAERRLLRGGQMAMIFQEPMSSLNPVMTVAEQISEALALHRPEIPVSAWPDTIHDALVEVRLARPEQIMHGYPHRLSGGQRQRVMIAMAMVCRPALLIMDEPTTALDVTVQAEILRLIKDLQQDLGMGLLLITHDFGVVAEVADRVAVMRRGQIVEQGPCQTLLQAPRATYTRRLLMALPQNLPRPVRMTAMSESPSPVLMVRGLKVYYPIRRGILRRTVDQVRAVDGIDLTLYPGQILALVGESGCGKTTLGRAILRLLPPTAGKVIFAGQDLSRLSTAALRPLRRRLQVVFQDPASALNPRLRVATALIEPQRVHGIGNSDTDRLERARAILAKVQLDEAHLWRYPHELSGGQRQRIAIARALVLDPEVLICDEITSALDVSVQAEILALLLTLREERGLSILLITHDLAVVDYISDTTVVMYRGRIVEYGPTATVCRQPQADYTRRLLAAVPKVS